MKLNHPLRLLLIGAPGSGKGTQTSKLVKTFPTLKTISSGDLLRKEIQQGSELGKRVKGTIKNGQLVPDEVVCDLVTNKLVAENWLTLQSSWLLDGFPRTISQAKILDNRLDQYKAALNLVVQLDVPTDVILNRICNRWVHIASGRVYNLDYNPPLKPGVDDVTGEPLTRRSDDTIEAFKLRLQEYDQLTKPLQEYYHKQGILHVVSGNTSDEIFPKLLSLILRRQQ